MLEGLNKNDIGSLVAQGESGVGTLTEIFDDGTVEVDWGRINHNCILGKERIKSEELSWCRGWMWQNPNAGNEISKRQDLLCMYEVCTCKEFKQDFDSFAPKCFHCGKYDPQKVPKPNQL